MRRSKKCLSHVFNFDVLQRCHFKISSSRNSVVGLKNFRGISLSLRTSNIFHCHLVPNTNRKFKNAYFNIVLGHGGYSQKQKQQLKYVCSNQTLAQTQRNFGEDWNFPVQEALIHLHSQSTFHVCSKFPRSDEILKIGVVAFIIEVVHMVCIIREY